MRNRFLVAAMALCALVVFVGMTGPPLAASDMSPILSVNFGASVTESAAPTADCVNYGLVVDNDVGVATVVMDTNTYKYKLAGARSPGTTKEDSALTGPRVSGLYIPMSEYKYFDGLRAGLHAAPTINPATTRVLRT